MLVKPNKSILKGRVRRVERAPDGWGANVEFAVDECAPAQGYADFVQAKPGSTLTVFAAEPETIRPGKAYTLVAAVLGGPRGERVVVEDARPTDD
jgi:hypothetical protein